MSTNNVRLAAPSGMAAEFRDSIGRAFITGADGTVTVDGFAANILEFLRCGYAVADKSGATRPTVTYAGMPFFDTSLNSGAGLPIWRNTANTAWINGAGTAV